MIHHVSIPARDPAHVARVLAELSGGYAGPFIGPFPGAWVVYQEDGHGSGIEIYEERTQLMPENENHASAHVGEVPAGVAFHALISVNVDRATIERIGAREGWLTRHLWRGPPGVRLFELYEFWIENRILLEVVTQDMLPAYLRVATAAAQRELLAQKGKR